jgi:parallel beta-helix repeat protein
VVRNNLITGNRAPYAGGGIYAGVRSSPVIENNVISGNQAGGWGGGGGTTRALTPAMATVQEYDPTRKQVIEFRAAGDEDVRAIGYALSVSLMKPCMNL